MPDTIQSLPDLVSTQAGPPVALIPLDPKARRVLIGLLVSLFLAVGLLPPLCLLLLSMTSRCGFTAQWNALVGATPLVPVPDGAILLSDRDANGNPIQSAGGTIQRLYGEVYSTSAPPDTVVDFYRQRGATCSQKGNGATAYWQCDVDASESGWGWVAVFSQEAYRVALPEIGVDSYHLSGPLPREGTLLRTFVNWCDDVSAGRHGDNDKDKDGRNEDGCDCKDLKWPSAQHQIVADRLPACEIGAICSLGRCWHTTARAIYHGRLAAAKS